MILRFEPTKFEEKAMPNTMAILPGPSLSTKRSKMRETEIKIYICIDGQRAATLIALWMEMWYDFKTGFKKPDPLEANLTLRACPKEHGHDGWHCCNQIQ